MQPRDKVFRRKWYNEGPMGAVLAQILTPLVLSLCMMICFYALPLTFAKAMILRGIDRYWLDGAR